MVAKAAVIGGRRCGSFDEPRRRDQLDGRLSIAAHAVEA
jgi:hypothetical protein